MGDSFAERMRKRAMERLERNASIIQSSNNFDYQTLTKKLKSPEDTVRQEGKENFNDNAIIILNTTKPVIAEHLTVRKSIDNMECDEPEAFIMRTRRKPLFPEEYCGVEKRDDVYVKHCKTRLGNLANKFKTFEEEDKSVPLRTIGKQDTTERRNVYHESNIVDVSMRKTVKSARNIPRREMTESASKTHSELPRNENLHGEKNVSGKIVLAESVINTLESQGFVKTDSDIPFMCDLPSSKNYFNKENTIVNPIPKPQRKFEVARKNAENLEPKEISNIYHSNFENNVFVQNSKKVNQEDNSIQDPCLLSVAERRKLFERRLAGEIEKPLTIDTTVSANTESVINVDLAERGDEKDNSDNECSTCEKESNEYSDFEAVANSRTPTSEEDVGSCHEKDESDVKVADISGYPMLQSVKQVKFMSTPKPGRLYPSVSDLDGEIEGDYNATKFEASDRTPNEDDSFGKEVLCATNSIFSSFQNSHKEMDESKKSKTDILTEINDLISPRNDTSLSPSPLARLSTAANVESEFAEKHKFINQVDVLESDVKKKIRSLEESIVKEKIILSQEIRALKYCLSTSFVNTSSHLEAEKLVLLSQLKIEAAENEIQRIKVENTVHSSLAYNSVSGNIVISKIKLPIKTSMIHDNLKDDIENNLLCVIKCGDLVMASEVVPVAQRRTKQDIDGTYIEFPDTITVSDVSSDFKIRIEIYNLIIDKKDPALIKGKDKVKKNKVSQSSKKKVLFGHYGDVIKNTHPSSFVMIGYMVFSQNVVQKYQWMLNKHHLPLVGMIMMELKFSLSKITVQKHGFLTMYEIISGYGAWSRYWFYLKGDKLTYWKYPEQENVQDPIGIFDLKRCITKDVVVVGYDVVFRPQTFILKFDSPNYLQLFKNLTEDRLLLSADTEEERIAWCSCFNDVLESVRSWSNSTE